MTDFFRDFNILMILLIALAFIYGRFEPLLARASSPARDSGMGLIFGSFALLNMSFPLQTSAGMLIDARSIMIVTAGAFGGWRSGVICAGMVAAYRLYLGGVGAPGDMGAVLCCAAVGIWFYRQHPDQIFRARTLMAMSAAAIIVTFAWLLLFPNAGGWPVLQQIAGPVALLYPAGILVIGAFLSHQRQQQRTQRALVEGERRFRAVFNNSDHCTALMTVSGMVVEVNQAGLTLSGVTSAEVIGRPFWELQEWTASPETRARLQNAIQEAAAGAVVSYEAEVQNSDRRAITLDFSIKPIRDEQGQVTLLISEGRDISDRKLFAQRERELAGERARVKVLEQFVDDTAHDLRTPVALMYTSTTIIGMALTRIRHIVLQLLNNPTTTPKFRQSLMEIEEHANKISSRLPIVDDSVSRFKNTVEGLAEIGRAESREQYHMRAADLNEVTSQSLETVQAVAEQKHISLQFEPQPDLGTIVLDSVRFGRVVKDLVENALLYTPAQGQVKVRTFALDHLVLLEVSDTGRGIDASELPLIFNHFYRSEEARAVHSAGAGLGLAIARQVVEMHQGKIEVESTPGFGSTFRVFLPRSEALVATS
jgi:PAS domain S-box-containing protein